MERSPKPKGGRLTKNPRVPQPKSGGFLLEIGTEELPWQMIGPATNQLAQSLDALLTNQRISHGRVRSFATPRRLAVLVEAVKPRQAPARQEFLGPPKNVGFTSEGKPTPAALGFAKAQGVKVSDLEVRQTPKGAYLCAVKQEEGQPTVKVLGDHLPHVIRNLSFPKGMRWNSTGVRFARPIRWLVALYGTTVVDVSVAGVHSGNRSWGHRVAASKGSKRGGVEVRSPEAYVASLERAGVVVDQNKRRAMLQAQLKGLARSLKGRIYTPNQEELLEQAVFSVEWPHAICGRFHSKYLELPQEVLITSMKEHQGFFSLVDQEGRLLPHFITATNRKLPDMSLIRKGNERVLTARLADAQYFYNEDRKVKLSDWVNRLHGVVFHQKVGSLHQKTERMISLAAAIAQATGFSGVKEVCQRAALLSKGDLTTGMVGEFPMLQGVMGGEYAKHDGEPEAVCLALGEYYLPRTPDDALPQTPVGKLLSLTDRLDTLVAFFRAGILPSGSEDPFGLRRHAFGMIRILIEGRLALNLVNVIKEADSYLENQGVVGARVSNVEEARESGDAPKLLLEFIADRLRYHGRTIHSLRDDVMDAVLAGRKEEEFDVLDLFYRMQAVQAITRQEDFDPLMVGFKRAYRIVEKEQWNSNTVNPELFEHPTEEVLSQAVDKCRGLVPPLIVKREYAQALKALIALKPSIDAFFDGVLVNSPVQAVRANRLSLLYRVDELFSALADFSRIQVQGS